MLIVTGTIQIDPADVERARAAAQVMMRETWKEDGCHVYEFSQVIGDETRFRIYEEWSDQAALDAHFATPHMAAFRTELSRIKVVSRELAKIQARSREPLG